MEDFVSNNTSRTNKLLIKNGYVVDPVSGISGINDILIADEVIIKCEKSLSIGEYENQGYKIIDAAGLLVTPGLVDMHVHLRDPGFTHKEDIISGCSAAVSGGVTSVLCMPNTNPVTDNEETITYINEKAKTHASAKVYICGAITTGMQGEQLSDFDMYKRLGVVAVSDDGKPVCSAKGMKNALKLGREKGLVVISHCEDLDLIDGGIMNEGKVSQNLNVKGMDRASEDYITAREIFLSDSANSAVHIAHVSTKGSTSFIKWAKEQGYHVTAETCPHYFWYTEDKLLTKDSNYRMNPPLRTDKDIKEIIKGICDGTFDCIITDHAPHTLDEKANFEKAPNGVVGMETSFAASYTKLVHENKLITIDRLVELMSVNPAKILGIPAGSVAVGNKADIAIFDLDSSFVVDAKKAHGKSENLIFNGETLFGKTRYTIVNGEIVYQG